VGQVQRGVEQSIKRGETVHRLCRGLAPGFWVQVQIGYIPRPEDPAAWLEALFAVVVSQVVYTGVKLLSK